MAHALLMAAWIVGLPLLFIRRWSRVTRAYGIHAISFILISQVSHLVLERVPVCGDGRQGTWSIVDVNAARQPGLAGSLT